MRNLEQLDKLEQYLKDNNYQYFRLDKEGIRDGKGFWKVPDLHKIIVYEDGGEWDAICHYGSYGAEEGLLEIFGSIVNLEKDGDTVVGWLTADDVIRRLEDDMSGNFVKIELKKRMSEERQAWLEGYSRGLADGKRNENTTLIFKTKRMMGVEQYGETLSDLQRQADRGVILLHPDVEFVQAVGNNPEVRLEYDDESEE